MWRKPAEAKPTSQAPEATAPLAAKQPTAPSTIASAPGAVAEISPAATIPAAPAASSFATPVSARGVSRITSGIRIKGEISGNDDLYIDGQVEGQFRFPQSKVTVGPNGRVQANIEAREIIVEGTVNGNLAASASVQLGASSHVQGSLTTPRIAIDDGARLRGKVEMTTTRASDSKQETALAPLVPAPPTKLTSAPQAIARASGE